MRLRRTANAKKLDRSLPPRDFRPRPRAGGSDDYIGSDPMDKDHRPRNTVSPRSAHLPHSIICGVPRFQLSLALGIMRPPGCDGRDILCGRRGQSTAIWLRSGVEVFLIGLATAMLGFAVGIGFRMRHRHSPLLHSARLRSALACPSLVARSEALRPPDGTDLSDPMNGYSQDLPRFPLTTRNSESRSVVRLGDRTLHKPLRY